MAFGFQTTLSTQSSCIIHRSYVPTACSLLWGQTQLSALAFCWVPVPYPDGLHWDLARSLFHHMTHPVHMPQADATLSDKPYVVFLPAL